MSPAANPHLPEYDPSDDVLSGRVHTPQSVKQYYRDGLRRRLRVIRRGPREVRGLWCGAGGMDLGELAEMVFAAEATPAAVLKESHINLTFRASLRGEEVVIKRYGFAGTAQRIRYRLRASRGRRDVAAAAAMIRAGLPSPEPLGFLEIRQGGLPHCSYAISACLPDVRTARSWIRSQLHRRPPAFRDQVAREVKDLLLDLYRLHIYHADTKTGNLLVTAPDDPERRVWHWIDLDCVRFGCPPSRRRVLRNLVQLNGSLGSNVPDEDRLAFLAGLVETFPWVSDPRVAEHIRAETLRRLRRELEGTCGP